jgi:hypothetical protein
MLTQLTAAIARGTGPDLKDSAERSLVQQHEVAVPRWKRGKVAMADQPGQSPLG